MKNDEPEIKPAYKNPLMEHYECDGQINELTIVVIGDVKKLD